MPNKSTIITIVITAIVVLAIAPRLRSLPLVKSIPTV